MLLILFPAPSLSFPASFSGILKLIQDTNQCVCYEGKEFFSALAMNNIEEVFISKFWNTAKAKTKKKCF